jgi:HD-GYP domain-containing protein (c-di-GMP phosphodiesterase class II)
MIDVKKEKIEIDRLSLGMYVSELDRPWIGTPFMLQGFLLDDEEDLETIIKLCKFVYIDRTKSTGNSFAPPTKQEIAIKRDGAILRVRDPSSVGKPSSKPSASLKQPFTSKTSFLDILRELKNYKSPENVASERKENEAYNIRHGANTAAQVALPYGNDKNTQKPGQNPAQKTAPKAPEESASITEQIGGFFGGLFSRDKSKSSSSSSPTEKKNTKQNQDDSYVLTFYEEEAPVENEIAVVYPIYEQSQIATREIFENVANNQDLDLTAVSDILDGMVESIGRTPDALLWLAKLKQTDDYSYNHALNVSITLMAFGNFLALSKKQIKELGLAGLLQDVGKVKISADILLKEGKLTREEYEYAKKHVDESLKILENTPDIPYSVVSLVAEHHERVDGSGYPRKLRESEISLTSQIAGLIDTYCAITSNKSYAKGVFHQQALDEIFRLSGRQFAATLVDQLVQFMGMYPVSSLVELNTGEVGVVIQQNQVRRLLPRLMLLLGPDKSKNKAPIMLNLLNSPPTPTGEPYRIVKSLAPDSYGLNPDDFYV